MVLLFVCFLTMLIPSILLWCCCFVCLKHVASFNFAMLLLFSLSSVYWFLQSQNGPVVLLVSNILLPSILQGSCCFVCIKHVGSFNLVLVLLLFFGLVYVGSFNLAMVLLLCLSPAAVCWFLQS